MQHARRGGRCKRRCAPLYHHADAVLKVKNARTYQVPDETAPGNKKDVEQDELAKGYAYGSTAVYIAESDRNVTTYETKQGLDIIGFVAKEQVRGQPRAIVTRY